MDRKGMWILNAGPKHNNAKKLAMGVVNDFSPS